MKPWMTTALFACALLPSLAMAQSDPAELYERGSFRRAAAACEQRLAANPNDAKAASVLARIRGEQDRFDEAIALGERAIAAAPNDADAHYALAEAYGQKASSVGVLSAAGLAGKFRKQAEATLALNPNHVDAMESMIEFYTQAPGMMGGDKRKAAEMTQRLTQIDPVRGWFQQAAAAQKAKDSTKVGMCWRRAAEADPKSARAKIALASWLTPRYRDPAEAEKLALEAIALEPWRTGAWQVLAALYAHQSRWSDLDATLAKAEAVDAEHLQPYYSAGRQLVFESREPVRAEQYMRKYLTKEPEVGAPRHAAAHWRLALALEQQGKKNEALAELQIAVRLDPKLEDAKKDLKRLRG